MSDGACEWIYRPIFQNSWIKIALLKKKFKILNRPKIEIHIQRDGVWHVRQYL